MNTKQCTRCHKILRLADFSKNKNALDGHKSACAPCLKSYLAKYYEENKARALLKAAEYREVNREVIRAKDRKRYKDIRRDPIKGDLYRAKRNTWYNKRMASDPIFKLKNTMRSRLTTALKADGKTKEAKTVYLLGCSVSYLKEYLEKQFEAGMSWKNYGDWHVDHIIPCSAFSLDKEEHQKVAFHYTNLQPLWAAPNLIKSASVPKNFNLQKHIKKTIKKINE